MGGNLFEDTVRIKREDVQATVEHAMEGQAIFALTDLPYVIVGSAGRAPTSGDIDIAIEYDGDLQELYLELCDRHGEENCKNNKGFQQVSVRAKIVDDYSGNPHLPVPGKDYVQIDFMLVDDVKLAEFNYGRDKESQILLSAMVKYFMPQDSQENEDGTLHIHRFYWSPSDGLARGTQVFNKKQDGSWAKKGKYIKDSKTFFTSPQLAVSMIFGPNLAPIDLMGDFKENLSRMVAWSAQSGADIAYVPDKDNDKSNLMYLYGDVTSPLNLNFIPLTVEMIDDLIDSES
tara:strand:+ start:23171 stop:24034 length:864 start_codon:yes stop_codon:yes gene_type:complete